MRFYFFLLTRSLACVLLIIFSSASLSEACPSDDDFVVGGGGGSEEASDVELGGALMPPGRATQTWVLAESLSAAVILRAKTMAIWWWLAGASLQPGETVVAVKQFAGGGVHGRKRQVVLGH